MSRRKNIDWRRGLTTMYNYDEIINTGGQLADYITSTVGLLGYQRLE
jgi:hypothetical protein